MKKRISYLLAMATVFLLTILLAGCNKNTVQGGAETGYPYSCSIAGNGTVTVKLNGKISPDYNWSASSDNESVITVSQKGKERGGKATFKLLPVSEGSAYVTFVRERETASTTDNLEYTTSEELASYEAEISGKDKDAVTTVLEVESAETDENVIPVPESSNREEVERTPKDRVCLITIRFTVTPNKKKFNTVAEIVSEEKLDAIISDAGENISYQIWPEDNGDYRLNLPIVSGGWLISSETEYTGTPEEIIDSETGEPTGAFVENLAKDDKGNTIIIDAYTMGGVRDISFEIVPLAQGKGVLYFSAPQEKKRLEIQFEINEQNKLSVQSHSVVTYEPAKAELSQTKADDKTDDGDDESHYRDDSASYEAFLESLNSETASEGEAAEGVSDNPDGEETEKPSEPEPVSDPTSNVFNG